MISTLRVLLTEALAEHGETWDDLLRLDITTVTAEGIVAAPELVDAPLDFGFGGSADISFTAWTARSVYIDVGYDGKTDCRYVQRHP